MVKSGPFLLIHLNFDNALHTASPDHHRHPDIQPVQTIGPVNKSRTGQQALLVAQIEAAISIAEEAGA